MLKVSTAKSSLGNQIGNNFPIPIGKIQIIEKDRGKVDNYFI